MAVEKFCGSAYFSGVRWRVLATCVLGLALAGCWNPKVKNAGFQCAATDNPPCPSGYYCVGGYCVDHPGETVTGDMATSSSSTDMAGVVQDMASTDMAHAVYDFSSGGSPDMTMCSQSGAICSKSNECCSGFCIVALCF